jgi:hypothetical protein
MQRAQVLLFWDYDSQWGADRSRSAGGAQSWGHLDFENTERLLELHAEYGVRACFAVVGAVALRGERPYHDPAQVRRIHEAGHEVASHSLRHDWLPALQHADLLEDLRASKTALEQCIGSDVVTFVPPFNQPFDIPARLSVSLSERREVPSGRTDLPRLCDALATTGYRFARVSYRSLWERILDAAGLPSTKHDSPHETINGITCVRLRMGAGFGETNRTILRTEAPAGGLWVLYGHPHSASSHGSPQSFEDLESLFRLLKHLKEEIGLSAVLPRDIITS